jgi:uncharacterized membrane protein (GlpM family)
MGYVLESSQGVDENCFKQTKRILSMQILMKIILSAVVVLAATEIGKKIPSMAGLIGVMPLVGALVLVWMYVDNKGNRQIMEEFTKGAIWGILPSILFYLVALFCFKKQLPFTIVMGASFSVWMAAAFVHQWLLK